MSIPCIHAPWRMDYIRSIDKPATGAGCFLCEAGLVADAPQAAARLVLWNTPLTTVLINSYPYTNGHLLIAPRRHLADLEDLTPEELFDMNHQTVAAIKLLKRAVSPQGFNVGINLSRVAGAGVPGHVHQHVVPRWNGDTNFMTVVGEVRVVPQAMNQLHQELARVRDELAAVTSNP
jgi:ATP adenylyltransferase